MERRASKAPTLKRRCKVYKCDETCDKGVTGVLPFVRHKATDEKTHTFVRAA